MAMLVRSFEFAAKVLCRTSQLCHCSVVKSNPFSLLSVRCLVAARPSAKPKEHPRSPFIIFYSDNYSDMARANPGVKVPDLGRMLGQMWRLLPDDQKELYLARYKEEKAVCDAKREAKLSTMTEEEKDKMRQVENDKKKGRILRKRRKLQKEMNKPKAQDVNPFFLYLKSTMIERGDAPVQQYIRGMAEHWKKLPQEDKEVYIKTARANSARYRQQLIEWEKRMVAQGHSELVRRSAVRKKTAKARGGTSSREASSEAAKPDQQSSESKHGAKTKAKSDAVPETAKAAKSKTGKKKSDAKVEE